MTVAFTFLQQVGAICRWAERQRQERPSGHGRNTARRQTPRRPRRSTIIRETIAIDLDNVAVLGRGRCTGASSRAVASLRPAGFGEDDQRRLHCGDQFVNLETHGPQPITAVSSSPLMRLANPWRHRLRAIYTPRISYPTSAIGRRPRPGSHCVGRAGSHFGQLLAIGHDRTMLTPARLRTYRCCKAASTSRRTKSLWVVQTQSRLTSVTSSPVRTDYGKGPNTTLRKTFFRTVGEIAAERNGFNVDERYLIREI